MQAPNSLKQTDFLMLFLTYKRINMPVKANLEQKQRLCNANLYAIDLVRRF